MTEPNMEFAPSARTLELAAKLSGFLEEKVVPAEGVYEEQVAAAAAEGGQECEEFHYPPVMAGLQAEARRRGLWNLFLTGEGIADRWGAGLTNLEYAPLAEISGRSHLAPEALNCSAPDTGNMELLAHFGTAEQQEQWLGPLLDGQMRSCFGMTEPDVASSDARNIQSRIDVEGDELVLNGRKWWSTGALSPRCRLAIFMGKSDPGAPPYVQQTMVLVPMDAPGVTVVRPLSVFGYLHGQGGHAEVHFEDVRLPTSSILGDRGAGFAMAQARLGPGRIHHCMRAIGMAERALELMCKRALARVAFGKSLAEQGVIQDWIARSRVEIEQARLLVHKTAWLMDTVGTRGARVEISAIKAAVPSMAAQVVDRAIQVHGAAGVSQDTALAGLYAAARMLRIADGPDEVHYMAIARRELRKWVGDGG